MGDTQLSWQDWGEDTRLWVAREEPTGQAQVLIKHLLYTQLYVMCGGGLKDPRKSQWY